MRIDIYGMGFEWFDVWSMDGLSLMTVKIFMYHYILLLFETISIPILNVDLNRCLWNIIYSHFNEALLLSWRHQMEKISVLLALCVGHRWIRHAELWCFLWSPPEQTIEQTIETPLIVRSLWRQCNNADISTSNIVWFFLYCCIQIQSLSSHGMNFTLLMLNTYHAHININRYNLMIKKNLNESFLTEFISETQHLNIVLLRFMEPGFPGLYFCYCNQFFLLTSINLNSSPNK